ncbi:hypothetical protein QSH99_26010, partial [Escherichia coli]|nr:hypothetical protein [Escherichia coli]MDP4371098.1 hypothetical protein [Escherichia coli]
VHQYRWTRLLPDRTTITRRYRRSAYSLSTSTQTRVSASSCKVEFRHGNITLENPSPELLTVLIRELSGRGR